MGNNRLKEIKDTEIKVLDKGFIKVVDCMENDDLVVKAARVSYGKSTKRNKRLCRSY